MVSEISIVCWKWNSIPGSPTTKKRAVFTSDHVNALQEMVSKNVKIPFRFICVTDDKEGIDETKVEVIPLWKEFRDLGGCFVRLGCFRRDFDLFGSRFLSIDLDCIIVGDITPLLMKRADFIIWAPENSYHRIASYCGSMWLMNAGCRPQVYEKFNPEEKRPVRGGKYIGGTDQLHISKELPNEKTFGKGDGIYNFVPDIYLPDRQLLPKTRIIFFNGRYLPDDKYLSDQYEWIRFHYPLAGTRVPEYNLEADKRKLRRVQNRSLISKGIRADLELEREKELEKQRKSEVLNVVCFWWKDWPGKESLGRFYIEKLILGIRQNIPEEIKYRIVLFTDKEIEIPEVDVRPLKVPKDLKWNLRKMYMYASEAELKGPVLSFDLDCVILDDLSELIFTLWNLSKSELIITCQAAYHDKRIGGSIVGFYPSDRLEGKLWKPILANQQVVERLTNGSERFFYQRQFTHKQVAFWEEKLPGAVLSYKRDCQNGLPEGPKVVRFHGFPRPHEVVDNWVISKWRNNHV